MAKDIKKKLKRDSFDLDDDLDLDSFGMNDLGGELSPESQKSKSRSPVTEVFKGTISGAATEVGSGKFMKDTLEQVLPQSYGTTFTTADKVIGKSSKLYDETIRELKPQLNSLGKKIDRLVPQEEGFLRKMTDKFIEATGGKDQISNSSAESQQEANIQSTIAGVFAANQEAQIQMAARTNAHENIKEGVQKKRFDTEITVLGGIHDNIARLTSYNDNITQAYQKKSLELQLRSYFVQKELVDYSRKYQEVTTKQFEAISKNTALPEFVKIHKSEIFKQELANKATGKMVNKLFGSNSFIDNFFQRLTPFITEKVGQISEGIQSGIGGLDSVETGVELNRDMGGSNARMFGEQLGAMGAQGLRDLFTPEIRTQIEKKFPNLKMTGEKWKAAIKNPQQFVNKLRKSAKFDEGLDSDNVFKSSAYNAINSLLDLGRPQGATDSLKSKKLFASDVPGVESKTNSKMLLSVTEIIPGYLARIHQELKTTRTGKEQSLLVYDGVKGSFKSSKRLDREVITTIKKTAKTRSSDFNDRLEQITKSMMGDELTPEQKEEFKTFLTNFTLHGDGDTSFDNLTDSKHFKGMSEDTRRKATEAMFYKTDAQGNRQRYNNAAGFKDNMDSLRDATPNVQDVIQQYLEAGHDKALINAGVIKMGSGGEYSLNMDNYTKFVMGEAKSSRLQDSDVNMKTNISKFGGGVLPGFSGKSVLGAINKTPIFNWNYKQGLGKNSENPKVGPMAQDVQRNLGDTAGPGGKKIDLVTLNGMNMSAIQELDKKVDGGGDQLNYLKLISENTFKALEKLDNLGKFAILGMPGLKVDKNFFGAFGNSVVSAGNLLKDALTGTGKFGLKILGKTTSVGIKGLSKGLGSLYDNRGKIDSTLRGAGKLGKDFAMGVGDMAYKGMERITGGAFKAAGKVLNFVRDIYIDADIYVKNETTPKIRKILAESGEYKDKLTGDVIRKYSDIKGEVVDKYGNIVLSNADIIKGLVDVKGNSIRSAFRNLYSGGKVILKLGIKAMSSVAAGAMNLASKSFKGFDIGKFGIGFGNKKATDAIVEIRDILKSWSKKKKSKGQDASGSTQTESQSSPGLFNTSINDQTSAQENKDTFVGPMPQKQAGSDTGEKKKGLFSKLGGFLTKAKTKVTGGLGSVSSIRDQLRENVSENLKMPTKENKGSDLERKMRINARRNIKAFNDKDGSGNRDGSWMDRLSKEAGKSMLKPKAGAEPDMTVKYKEGGLLSGIMSKLSGLISGASGLISGIGSIFTKFGGVGKLLGKGALSTAARALTSVPTALRALPAIAGVISAGTIGSALGGIAAAGGALGAFLISPPGIAAMLVAGGIYGAYKTYKYFTRNNLTKYELYRAYQYGFSNRPEHAQNHYKLMELEGLILDKHLVVANGEPKISNSLEWKEVSAIFGIPQEDKEQNKKLEAWFTDRFKFFFINHLRVLNSINPKVSLDKVEKLKPTELKRYLELTSFDDGPHDANTSPVKDVAELSDNRELIRIEVKNLLAKVASEISTTPVTTEDETKKYAKKVPPMVYKPEETQPNKPSRIVKQNETVLDSEDGKVQAAGGVDTTSGSAALGGMKVPALANGAMRDGSSGAQYLSLKAGVDIQNIHPLVRKNLLAMAQEYGELTGKTIPLNDGHRSFEQQAAIHKKYPNKSAPPGSSMHEFGLALDSDRGVLGELDKMGLMKKYGFTRPVGSEPWHFEPAGVQLSLQESKDNPNTAAKLIEYGLGRGGGGLGTLDSKSIKGRDYTMAKALLDATASGTINNQLSKNDVDLASKAMAVPKPTKYTDNYSTGTDAGSTYDAMGNFTGGSSTAVNERSIKAAKAPTSEILTKNVNTDAMGNITSSEDGKVTGVGTNATGDIGSIIAKAAAKVGIDPNLLKTFATLESSMNPNARSGTSSASGLFQFTKDTWQEQLQKFGKKHNLASDASPMDPVASSLLAAEYTKNSMNILSKVKDNPDDLDLYLAHVLGAQGATKFLTANDNVPGSQMFPKAASANKEIFYDGRRPRTIAEIRELFKKKVQTAGGKVKTMLASNSKNVTTTPSSGNVPVSLPGGSDNNIQPVAYKEDVPKKKSFADLQRAPDLQATSQPVVDIGKNTNMDLNTVNNNLGESLNVQKQMLDVLSKIHGLISNKSGTGDKSKSEVDAPAYGMPNASKKESLPNPALDLRRRTS